ncbi:0d8e48e5-ba14-4f77-b0d4-6775f3f37305 [Sclerotinia trifoliorum]|uniref:0d8e48e5-ba14-4f77-b0d4-6775f3f37305 n=1 Tax=Sclerotinia trifoliorum TaxID=28548 RepID=A0A8H2VRI0_9HELO|nr:0d8e48e5-ba14-4f77-b0d4-6775f3f37305 [Sclerotinia trifoliorum]
MGNRRMTPEAARRIAKAHPGSGFARRSVRAGHSNSQRDAQSQATRDREMQDQIQEHGASTGYEITQTDKISPRDKQEQGSGDEQCLYCTTETLCARHASKWGW